MREFTHLQVYTKLGVGRGAEVCVCERARALLSRWCETLHIHVHIPSIITNECTTEKCYKRGKKAQCALRRQWIFVGI